MATATEPALHPPQPAPTSRVVFTEGGKGGVGKTAFTAGLVEWYQGHGVPFTLLDLDTENKARGSLAHYFRDRTRKVNIHTAEGLDAFLDALDEGTSLVIADLGSGSGQVAYRWFDSMWEGARELGVAFTAIGLVTPDPASVESVLSWAHALQHRVDYLIVKNALSEPADFSYWERTTAAEQFRQAFHPREITMEYRHSLRQRDGVSRGGDQQRGNPLLCQWLSVRQLSRLATARGRRRHWGRLHAGRKQHLLGPARAPGHGGAAAGVG